MSFSPCFVPVPQRRLDATRSRELRRIPSRAGYQFIERRNGLIGKIDETGFTRVFEQVCREALKDRGLAPDFSLSCSLAV